jgi:hypothetical protein
MDNRGHLHRFYEKIIRALCDHSFESGIYVWVVHAKACNQERTTRRHVLLWIGLSAQYTYTLLGSNVSTIGRAYVINFKRMRIFTLTSCNFLTWYSWKCHMVRKNVMYVIFSNARKAGLNWSLEVAFANYIFFQCSSAFHNTRNWVGLEKEDHIWMRRFNAYHVEFETQGVYLH